MELYLHSFISANGMMLKQAQGKLYLSFVHLLILPLSYSLLVQILLSTVPLAILSYFPAGAQ
jgi:hypothetical protein